MIQIHKSCFQILIFLLFYETLNSFLSHDKREYNYYFQLISERNVITLTCTRDGYFCNYSSQRSMHCSVSSSHSSKQSSDISTSCVVLVLHFFSQVCIVFPHLLIHVHDCSQLSDSVLHSPRHIRTSCLSTASSPILHSFEHSSVSVVHSRVHCVASDITLPSIFLIATAIARMETENMTENRRLNILTNQKSVFNLQIYFYSLLMIFDAFSIVYIVSICAQH